MVRIIWHFLKDKSKKISWWILSTEYLTGANVPENLPFGKDLFVIENIDV